MSKAQKRKHRTNVIIANDQLRRQHVSQAIQYQRGTLQTLVNSVNGVLNTSTLADSNRHTPQSMTQGRDTHVMSSSVKVLSQADIGGMSNVLPDPPTQVRRRRGRPPKVRPMPVLSEPIPTAARRGRPRKHPAVAAARSQPSVQTDRQSNSSSSLETVTTPSLSNNVTTSSEQLPDRGISDILSENVNRVTPTTRSSPLNIFKQLYPDTFVFKTPSGNTMKLIPIIETNREVESSAQNSDSIRDMIANIGTSTRHATNIINRQSNYIHMAIDGNNCIKSHIEQDGNQTERGDNISNEANFMNTTSLRCKATPINVENIHDENSSSRSTVGEEPTTNHFDNQFKLSNIESMDNPIMIEPCDPDSISQNDQDNIILPHVHIPLESQTQIRRCDSFHTLPTYMKDIVKRTEYAASEAPRAVDSKETIPMLDDGTIMSQESGDGMGVGYPHNSFRDGKYMSPTKQIRPTTKQTTIPLQTPMELYNTPTVVAPETYQYQAGDYQSGWAEPYSDYNHYPSMPPQYVQQNNEQSNAPQQYYNMHYPGEYACNNMNTDVTKYTDQQGAPSVYYSSGDGLVSHYKLSKDVKNEAGSCSQDEVDNELELEQELHRSTAYHISNALNVLT